MDEIREKPQRNTDRRMLLWLLGFVLIAGGILGALGYQTAEVDPFFHYHQPDTERYFYELNSERNQNDGIMRNFDYDAIITGTSMAQNLKATDVDELFGVHSVKTTYAGSSFREIADRLRRGLRSNPSVKLVVRSLDMDFFFQDYDEYGNMATGEFPTYLYDDNPLNDYKYLLNRDILFERVFPMKITAADGLVSTGITDFDSYSNWMLSFIGSFGVHTVAPEGLENYPLLYGGLTDSEKLRIRRNITANIIEIAEEYPDVQFYMYITPYSVAWWNSILKSGTVLRQLQAEQYIIEHLLPYENIHLFSYNTVPEIITDLNNYKDLGHYGEWVNAAILRWMKDGVGQLTEENYLDYIQQEFALVSNFDYTSVSFQTDYENDYDAESALMSKFFHE